MPTDFRATAGGDGKVQSDAYLIGTTEITSTASELNILDGVTATATNLNVLAGALEGSATIDPASLIDAAGATSTITVTGAALGDFTVVSAPYDLQSLTVTSYVSAADTVSIRIQNESGATVDLASGVWKALVIKG